MAWGDDDEDLGGRPGALTAGPQAGDWGASDPLLDAIPGRSRKTSQSLGLMEGIARPVQNVNRVSTNMFGIPDPQIKRDADARAEKGLKDYFSEREQTERPGFAGEVAGTIIGTAPAIAITRNPWVSGAAQGAMATEANDAGGVAVDMGKGAALNWFGGKVMDTVANAVAPVIAPAVRRLADKDIEMTPGMVKGPKAMAREDKRMSRPYVGDSIAAARQGTHATFNTAAVNEVLAPLGKTVPSPVKPGHDSVAYAKKQITDAYDLVIPNLSVSINGQQFAQNLGPAFQALPAAQQKEFMRTITLHMKNGQLSGQAVKDAQEALRTEITDYAAGGPIDRKMARAFTAADEELTQALIAQNPKHAADLTKVNTAYKGYRTLADAASRTDDGTVGTGQFRQAVRRADRSKNKDASARGEAFMQEFSRDAREVLPAKVPDSGTSGRNQASNLFANLGGAADLGAWKTEQLLSKIALLPRSQQAAAMAEFLRRIKAPAGAGSVALTQQSGN